MKSSVKSSGKSSVIILAGAGHANIQCLKMMAMRPLAGIDVILVSEGSAAPYSGMLPGYMMGRYEEEDIHFNLWKLTSQAGVMFIRDRIVGIDANNKLVQFASGRAPLRYDVLSMNIGITPERIAGHADQEKVFSLKPIARLVAKWKRFVSELPSLPPQRIAVVGGGAAGVETAVAIVSQIRRLGRKDQVCLLHKDEHLVSEVSDAASRKISKELRSQGIDVKLSSGVSGIDGTRVTLFSGVTEEFDYIFLATAAKAPGLLKSAGFQTNDQGFLSVNASLQSISHSDIFGAGDCVHFTPSPLPKAGVFAVREGRVLAHNLKAYAEQRNKARLQVYKPQRNFLKLIHTSYDQALASRGRWSFASPLFRVWKQSIDRKFMQKFGDLPADMNREKALDTSSVNTCGGCGAKVSQSLLSQVLFYLRRDFAAQLPDRIEDCYPLPPTQSEAYISVDGLRSFIQDPFLFGRISALHALSDLWVSGVIPRAITVSVGLSHRSPNLQQNYLLQLMSGVLSVCKEYGLKLSNAHTFENAEDHLSLTVVGEKGRKILRKSGAQENDLIVLSKPLGSGIALQALMKGQLSIKQMDLLLHILATPNTIPTQLVGESHSATDITGFGLIGHLLEILQASNKSCAINHLSVPLMLEIDSLLKSGNRSFLIDKNQSSFSRYVKGQAHDALWDPQTNGPILLTIAEEKQHLLPSHWNVIGKVRATNSDNGGGHLIEILD